MLKDLHRNHSPTQNSAGAVMLLAGIVLLLRPYAITGTTAFIAERTGIHPLVFALSFVVCGGIVLVFYHAPPRFLALHIPLLFYLIMACWYIVTMPQITLFPLAIYAGYCWHIISYTLRSIHAIPNGRL